MNKFIASFDIPNDIKFINVLSNVLHVFFVLLVFLCIIQFFIKNKIENLSEITIKGEVTRNDFLSIRNQINLNYISNIYNLDLIQTKKTFESINWINHARVKRVFPSHIEVKLSEFKSKAIWGNRSDLKLVDDRGVIFEATMEEIEYEKIPQFIGLDSQCKVMLDMYNSLVTAFFPLKHKIKILELNGRGSWIVVLDNGAYIELGRGNALDVIERVRKFVVSIELALINLDKKVDDIKYIDLRHNDSYAMRLQGLSTLDLTTVNTTVKK